MSSRHGNQDDDDGAPGSGARTRTIVLSDEVDEIDSPTATVSHRVRAPGESIPPMSGPSLLEIHETIGEGGFGLVRRATQRSVGREVAVKTLRREVQTEAARHKLIEEGRVTGRLEHPNIMPVYDIRQDDRGAPIVVLKRIDGVEWRKLMHDADAVREKFGADDLLEWNLRILLQVGNALRFAHSHGVIHRDVKPDNVMIGGFGEVYLLDWGIAIGFRKEPDGFPREGRNIAGTPAYMAPEQVRRGRKAPALGPHTDIYLLGGVLHELASGQPPHIRQSRTDPAARIAPPLPDDAPAELQSIVRRAMASDTEKRFPSVDEFQRSLETFLAHRNVAGIVEAADLALGDLEEAAGSTDEDGRQRAHRAFHECRFGYKVALDAWPESALARDGLRQATLHMVEHELSCGRPEAAALHLSDLEGSSPELQRKIKDALASQIAEAERVARLTQLGRDADPGVGERTRVRFALLFGALWTIVPLFGVTLDSFGVPVLPRTHIESAVYPALFLALFAMASATSWRDLGRTAFNRRFVGGVGFLFVVQTVGTLGAGALGVDLVTTEVFYPLLWWAVASFVSLVFDRRLSPASLAYLVAFGAAIAWPSHRYWAMGLANLVLVTTLVRIWRRDARHGPVERRSLV